MRYKVVDTVTPKSFLFRFLASLEVIVYHFPYLIYIESTVFARGVFLALEIYSSVTLPYFYFFFSQPTCALFVYISMCF